MKATYRIHELHKHDDGSTVLETGIQSHAEMLRQGRHHSAKRDGVRIIAKRECDNECVAWFENGEEV